MIDLKGGLPQRAAEVPDVVEVLGDASGHGPAHEVAVDLGISLRLGGEGGLAGFRGRLANPPSASVWESTLSETRATSSARRSSVSRRCASKGGAGEGDGSSGMGGGPRQIGNGVRGGIRRRPGRRAPGTRGRRSSAAWWRRWRTVGSAGAGDGPRTA